jgi:hypothetical protein
LHDDTAQSEADGLRVVFCGGCNPQIDRSALAAALRGDPALGPGAVDHVTVHLSGCGRACASGRSLTLGGSKVVVVAGECVDGRPTPGHALAETIRHKLKE